MSCLFVEYGLLWIRKCSVKVCGQMLQWKLHNRGGTIYLNFYEMWKEKNAVCLRELLAKKYITENIIHVTSPAGIFDYFENWKMHWKDKEIAYNSDVQNHVHGSLDYISFMPWSIIVLYNVLFFRDLSKICPRAITFNPYTVKYWHKFIVKLDVL